MKIDWGAKNIFKYNTLDIKAEKRKSGKMKTTVDLPDPLFRRAKSRAAVSGISLKRFITQAVEQKLNTHGSQAAERPWMSVVNAVPRLPRGLTKQIEATISESDLQDIEMQHKEVS